MQVNETKLGSVINRTVIVTVSIVTAVMYMGALL